MKTIKRLLAMLMAMLMFAASAGAEQYTLPQKMHFQTQPGNGGLRGSFSVQTEGEAEWLQPFELLTGVELCFTAIQDEAGWQIKGWLQDGEAQRGTTWVWRSGKGYMASSELLPDELLSLVSGMTGNPEWLSAAQAMAELPPADWSERWETAMAGISSALEIWLGNYAAAPETEMVDGRMVMTIRYDISEEDVRYGLNAFVSAVLADEDLMILLRSMATPEQQAVYLNENLLTFYREIIAGMKLTGGIQMARRMTVKGEDLGMSITVPSLMPGFEYMSLNMTGEAVNSICLSGESGELELQLNSTDENYASGHIRVAPAGKEAFIAAFVLTKTYEAQVDGEERSHELSALSLAFMPEGSEEEITAELSLHFSSKSAQRNPTTLISEFTVTTASGKLTLHGEAKTTSPWKTELLPDAEGEDILSMTEERVGELTEGFMSNLMTLYEELHTAADSIPTEEETAEETEEAEAAEVPAGEATEDAKEDAAE